MAEEKLKELEYIKSSKNVDVIDEGFFNFFTEEYKKNNQERMSKKEIPFIVRSNGKISFKLYTDENIVNVFNDYYKQFGITVTLDDINKNAKSNTSKPASKAPTHVDVPKHEEIPKHVNVPKREVNPSTNNPAKRKVRAAPMPVMSPDVKAALTKRQNVKSSPTGPVYHLDGDVIVINKEHVQQIRAKISDVIGLPTSSFEYKAIKIDSN